MASEIRVGTVRIELTTPGTDAYLEVIRAVVGRSARLAGFSFDGVEDLVLAADEAAVLLLSTRPEALRLRIAGAHDGVEVLLHVRDPELRWPPEAMAEHTGWQVLHALCERVWIASPHPGIGLFQGLR
ncbi:MAG: hypothetical protein WD990_13570 [Acidimicrobiia bacterium]